MRIALLFVLAGGCMTSEPVREGEARVQLDSAANGTAYYRVVSGSNDSACAHGEHFTPTTGGEVLFGPRGGARVELADRGAGTYEGSAQVAYASAYEFSVNGEVFELAAPPVFSATVRSMSANEAVIELSDASVSSDVVIHMPNGQSTARTLVGSPATISADFSARGEYQIDVIRAASIDAGIVEIQRATTFTR